jgi:uncharacterized protein involved in outer membrane biogenesis
MDSAKEIVDTSMDSSFALDNDGYAANNDTDDDVKSEYWPPDFENIDFDEGNFCYTSDLVKVLKQQHSGDQQYLRYASFLVNKQQHLEFKNYLEDHKAKTAHPDGSGPVK